MRHLDILIAAPSPPKGLANWGDYHFARELQLALHRLGVTSRLLHRNTHAHVPTPGADSDLLVLRGKFTPGSDWLRASGYGLKAAWIISWPLSPSRAELVEYDLLLVASEQDRPRLEALSGRPTRTLLQASAFAHRRWPRQAAGGVLFVGNCRGVERPIVAQFSRAEVPLELIGMGWETVGLTARAPTIANTALPSLYGSALAVLNDHHGDMAAFGYLNNRVFDVLACGVPVITDAAPGCPMELEPAVVRLLSDEAPSDALQRAQALREDGRLMERVAWEVEARHSFDVRALSLMEALDLERS